MNTSCCSPDGTKPGRHKCEATTTTTTLTADRAVTKCKNDLPTGSELDLSGCQNAYEGDTCTVKCAEKYTGESRQYTCGAGNAFAGTAPTCAEIKCQVSSIKQLTEPGRPYNYTHNCDNVMVDKPCMASCPAGFEVASGESAMYFTCMPNGDFSGWLLTACRKQICKMESLPLGKGVDSSSCEGVKVAVLSPARLASKAVPQYSSVAPTWLSADQLRIANNCLVPWNRGWRGLELHTHATTRPCIRKARRFAKQVTEGLRGTRCVRMKAAVWRSRQIRWMQIRRARIARPSNARGYAPLAWVSMLALATGKLRGQVVTFCVIGYDSNDVATSTCKDNEAFSAISGFRCSPKVCGDLSSTTGFSLADGAAHTCTGKKYKQSRSAFCIYGYTMTSPVRSLLRDDHASHAGFVSLPMTMVFSAPTCEAKPCIFGMPSKIGIVHNCTGVTTYGMCTAGPADGYEIVSGATVTLTCLPDGVLVVTDAPALPTVQPMLCAGPAAETGVATSCVGERVTQG